MIAGSPYSPYYIMPTLPDYPVFLLYNAQALSIILIPPPFNQVSVEWHGAIFPQLWFDTNV